MDPLWPGYPPSERHKGWCPYSKGMVGAKWLSQISINPGAGGIYSGEASMPAARTCIRGLGGCTARPWEPTAREFKLFGGYRPWAKYDKEKSSEVPTRSPSAKLCMVCLNTFRDLGNSTGRSPLLLAALQVVCTPLLSRTLFRLTGRLGSWRPLRPLTESPRLDPRCPMRNASLLMRLPLVLRAAG